MKTAHPLSPDPRLMTHPYLTILLTRARREDLGREAARARLASEARAATRAHVPVAGALVDDSVTLRPCRTEDRVPLARLAALHGRDRPSGPVLVAEVGGELRAALSLSDGSVVANPLDPTTTLAALLREYSRQPSLRARAFTTGSADA